MGKLKIQGNASKEYEYDIMEITVRFQAHESSSSDAVEKVTGQCEECLAVLSEHGISLSDIRIGEDSVEQEYYAHELDVCATRSITLKLPFDVSYSNYFMELIREKGYAVDVNIAPGLSNKSEIRNELLKLAIEDSKNKAAFIAGAMEQKVTGIDSVEIRGDYNVVYGMCCEPKRKSFSGPQELSLSNSLKAPTTTESSAVEVVWIIE